MLDQQLQGLFPLPLPALPLICCQGGNIVPGWELVQPRLVKQREPCRY